MEKAKDESVVVDDMLAEAAESVVEATNAGGVLYIPILVQYFWFFAVLQYHTAVEVLFIIYIQYAISIALQ